MTTVDLDEDDVFINHDTSITLPYQNDYVYVKRATSLIWMISGSGFEVLFDPNGRLYIRLFPHFSEHVGIEECL